MRCKHPLRWGMRLKETVDGLTWVKCPDDEATHLECCDCHEHLPWGHSDEAPVRVEVRAAELAVAPLVSIERWPATMHGQEPHGWMGHRRDDTPIDPQQSYWAGWLAREIHTHDGGGE